MVMLHDLKNIFHLLTIFLCLLFAWFVLLSGRGRRTSNRLLASFLIVRAAAELGGVFFHFLPLRRVVSAAAPQLFYIDLPFDFFYIPLLYLYVLSLTRKDFDWKKALPVHLAWPVLISLLATVRLKLWSTAAARQLLSPTSRFLPADDYAVVVLGAIQFFFYAALALVALKRYRAEMRGVLSTVEPVNLSWLNFFLIGFSGWKLLSLIDYGVWLAAGSGPWTYALYIGSEVTFLVFLAVLFFKGLRQSEVLLGENAALARPKYEKTPLGDELKNAYKVKLVQFMETQKPYLDPSLSLAELARKVAIPPHHLSQLLNSSFGQNFFDFVNSYRIRESQRLLLERRFEERTILDVLYETGFNSKSVFNSVFKKYTGMTPSQFRKVQNSRSH